MEPVAPEMATAVKPSRQPRTESCVVSVTGPAKRRQGDCRQNESERSVSPEIDRGGSNFDLVRKGRAQNLKTRYGEHLGMLGVHAAGMQSKGSM